MRAWRNGKHFRFREAEGDRESRFAEGWNCWKVGERLRNTYRAAAAGPPIVAMPQRGFCDHRRSHQAQSKRKPGHAGNAGRHNRRRDWGIDSANPFIRDGGSNQVNGGLDMDTNALGFPFRLNEVGQVATMDGDENLRAKIVQVVLTAPGERVNLPSFGCGLHDLVFDPNNEILAAVTEFSITKALQQWLSDDIIVNGVDVNNVEGELQIEVSYIRRDRLEAGKVKIAF